MCIAAGSNHSAAVTEDGILYTWGKGSYGRLGHGEIHVHVVTMVFNRTIVYTVTIVTIVSIVTTASIMTIVFVVSMSNNTIRSPRNRLLVFVHVHYACTCMYKYACMYVCMYI